MHPFLALFSCILIYLSVFYLTPRGSSLFCPEYIITWLICYAWPIYVSVGLIYWNLTHCSSSTRILNRYVCLCARFSSSIFICIETFLSQCTIFSFLSIIFTSSPYPSTKRPYFLTFNSFHCRRGTFSSYWGIMKRIFSVVQPIQPCFTRLFKLIHYYLLEPQ